MSPVRFSVPGFNPLDWAIVLMLVYSTVRAALRGFVRVAFSLAGAIVGFLVASWFYHALAPHLAGLLTSPPLQLLAAYALLLFGTLVSFGIVGALVHRGTYALGLGALNRLAGAAFGLLRGAVLAAGILTALLAFLPAAPWVAKSTLAPCLLRAVGVVSFGIPSELQRRLSTGAEHLKHASGDWIKSAP